MKKLSLFAILFLALSIFLGTSRTVAAQDDPPTRVARLSYIQGSVSYQPGGDDNNEDWVAADPNRPLTTGDNLWSDENSRGEIHIGSTSIRLSSQTGISFLNLDDNTIQIQLAQGAIEVRVRNFDPDHAYEIDTPNLAFTINGPGRYRIQTDPDGNSTMIVVRDGQGQATGGGQSFDVNPGQRYTFSGTDQLNYDVQPAVGLDAFEMWSQSRDQREDASASARYVSRDMDGVYDLDDNGDWQQDPEYGAVWIPRNVAVGWAPYQDGHWVWVAPWGWTWVDSQPWGFAPFHYGRWTQVRGTWGWVPGPPAVRPVYAPALVAFVGGGPGGFGVSVGFGGGFSGVAWFPLGPRDVYLPSYHTSALYVQNVNISNTRVVNVTQVTNVYNTYHTTTVVNNVTVNRINYTYANNAAAVTAVSRETFVGAQPVQAAAVRVTPAQLQSARVVEAAPLAPTRASYVSASARVTPQSSKPPVAFAQKPVVARIAPPAPPARPGAARVAPRVVSAGVAPKGNQPAARTTATITPRPNQPTPRPGAVNQPAPRANPEPAARTNEPPARTNPPVNNQPSRSTPPAERPNDQVRPAPTTTQSKPNAPEKPVTPERPIAPPAERPAEKPAPPPPPPPPPKNVPPARTNDENRDERPDARKPEPPQPEKKEATPPKAAPAKDNAKPEKKPKDEKPPKDAEPH